MDAYRTKEKCSNCPFHTSGPGLKLRRSLAPGRWKEITDGLLAQQHFHCHKTVEEDEDGEQILGTGLICAGSIEWQARKGLSSQFLRICERLRSRKART